MADYKEIVKGRIISRESSAPLGGAEVKVFDKDVLLDDRLGEAVTDDNGYFQVEFTSSDFKGGSFEDRPDIYLKVKNPLTGKTSKSKVYDELSGEIGDDDEVETMDLGDVPVD
ncbi:MAG: hypothetical protein GY854_09000 [Deltaproteobacteria bacterium]|nr:hypothetical protein [Deltaproteobacteria bacterium]